MMNHRKQPQEIQYLQIPELTQESDQSLLPHRNNFLSRIFSRSKYAASAFFIKIGNTAFFKFYKKHKATILLIISGIILYTENIIELFFKLDFVVPAFGAFRNFVYAMAIPFSAILIMFASRMNPFKKAYIVPLYAYMNMIIGNIVLVMGYKIFELWWYRILILGTAVLVYLILSKTIRYYEIKEQKDEIRDELLEMYKKQEFDEK